MALSDLNQEPPYECQCMGALTYMHATFIKHFWQLTL